MHAIVDALTPLVTEFRTSDELELEGLVGCIKGNRFISGVEFPYSKTLFDAFARSKDTWSKTEEASFATYSFPGGIRGRYTVTEKPRFVEKQRVSTVDIACQDRTYDLRINLKRETPRPGYVAKVPAQHVRLQKRWSFRFRESWQYDFTKVVSGKTKETACESTPVYEIELELLNRSELARDPTRTDRQLAEDIVTKLGDLLGRFTENYTPLPLSLQLHSVVQHKQRHAVNGLE